MGLLDKLEEEAARRRAESEASSQQREEAVRLYARHTIPAFEQLFEFLQKLTRNLEFLQQDIRITYQVPGYGAVSAQVEPKFELAVQSDASKREIKLSFHALIQFDASPTVDVQGASRYRAIEAQFLKHRIGGITVTKRDANGEVIAASFRARGKIPMQVQIHAEASHPQVRFQFLNFEAFGQAQKTVPAEQLGEELYDQLALYITSEDFSFMREALSEDVKKQLQQKIAKETQRRRAEDLMARQQVAEQQRAHEEQKFSSRLAKGADALARKLEGTPLAGLLDKFKSKRRDDSN